MALPISTPPVYRSYFSLRCPFVPLLSYQFGMSDPPQAEAKQSKSRVKKKLKKAYDLVALHFSKHAGVGFICSVAYFDP